jgi:hypothetical protein
MFEELVKFYKKINLFLLQLWRVSESEFRFRTTQGQFLTCNGRGCTVSATAKSPLVPETFEIKRNEKNRIHIKIKNGPYLQVLILFLSNESKNI